MQTSVASVVSGCGFKRYPESWCRPLLRCVVAGANLLHLLPKGMVTQWVRGKGVHDSPRAGESCALRTTPREVLILCASFLLLCGVLRTYNQLQDGVGLQSRRRQTDEGPLGHVTQFLAARVYIEC